MGLWDGYQAGGAPTGVRPTGGNLASGGGGSFWGGYKANAFAPGIVDNGPKSPLEQHLVSSFQAIDSGQRQRALSNLAAKANAGDKQAARSVQLLTPHLNAPTPATPDYTPKDIGSKVGAALYGLGSGIVTTAKNTAQDVATAPHLINAAALALGSMGKGDHGEKLAHNKQVILNEANKSSFARGIGLGKTVAEANAQPVTKQLAEIGGRTLENVLNVATLGEGMIGKQALEQGVKAVASKASVNLATKQAVNGSAGYIRNLASGQFSRAAVHSDDASVMASFIDHVRGLSKLAPAQAHQLELDASRIAEHYNIGGKAATPAKLANAFDRVLSASPQALRKGVGEAGSIGLPQGLKPSGKLLTGTAGQRLLTGAKIGAGYGVANAGENYTTNPGDIAKTVGTSALTGGALAAGAPLVAKAISKTAQGIAKWMEKPVEHVAESRVIASGKQFGSQADYNQAVKTEAVQIKSDPNQLKAIDEAYNQNGFKGLTADTGKQPTQVPVTVENTKGSPNVMTAEQGAKGRAIESSTKQNLSSRVKQYEASLQPSIKGIEESGGYQKLLAERGGDKVITNESVLNAAKQLGPLDEHVIMNARPLDKIDTVTLVRAKATLDSAAKDFTDAWQSGKLTDSQLTRMSKHISSLEAGYKIMSAEPGRATQIQSTFIDDAFKRAQKLKELVDTTKGATPEIRNQRIAQDLAAFDKAIAKAKQSGVFSGETITKFQNMVSEYATAAKLTSPLTHGVNIASNVATLLQRGAERLVTTSWGAAKGETTLGEAKYIFGSSQGFKTAITQFAKDFKQSFNPKAADVATFADKGELKSAIPGVVGKVIRTPFNLLSAGDNFFKTMLRDSEHHQMAFGKAYQEGFRGSALSARIDELVKKPTPEMTAKAEKAALEFTFQDDPGVIANGLTGILAKLPLMRLLIPFVKTPTNIVKFQYQRSPLGLFSVRNIKDVAAGGIERREAIARLGIGAGMSIGAGMAVMNAGDNIRGAAPTNQGEKDNFYTSGKKPYSILIGGRWWQYNRFQPLGLYVTQAVGLRDALVRGESKTAGNILSSMAITVGKGIADLPFVSGVSNVIAALNDPSNQSLANKAFGQLITGLIPNASRDIANAQDSTPRVSKSISDQVKAMIPGLKQTLPARPTVLGTEQVDTRTGLERGLFKITSNDQSSRVTKALDQIGKETGYYPQPPKANAKVNGKTLTPEQFSQYQKLSGNLFASKLEKALNDANFNNLTAADKKRTVEKMVNDAHTKAGDQIVGKPQSNPHHRVKNY